MNHRAVALALTLSVITFTSAVVLRSANHPVRTTTSISWVEFRAISAAAKLLEARATNHLADCEFQLMEESGEYHIELVKRDSSPSRRGGGNLICIVNPTNFSVSKTYLSR